MGKLLLIILSLVLICSSCSPMPQKSQQKYSDATGLYYQELNGYTAAVVNRDFLSVSCAEWIDNIPLQVGVPGYYQYIQADFENWEMVIYLPSESLQSGAVIDKSSMYFSLKDDCINIFFDESNTGSSEVILLIQGPKARKWPFKSTLQIGGKSMECLGAYEKP